MAFMTLSFFVERFFNLPAITAFGSALYQNLLGFRHFNRSLAVCNAGQLAPLYILFKLLALGAL